MRQLGRLWLLFSYKAFLCEDSLVFLLILRRREGGFLLGFFFTVVYVLCLGPDVRLVFQCQQGVEVLQLPGSEELLHNRSFINWLALSLWVDDHARLAHLGALSHLLCPSLLLHGGVRV